MLIKSVEILSTDSVSIKSLIKAILNSPDRTEKLRVDIESTLVFKDVKKNDCLCCPVNTEKFVVKTPSSGGIEAFLHLFLNSPANTLK